MKKLLIATVGLAAIAAPFAASAEPFHNGARYERVDRNDDAGGAIAAGLFGAFLGAAVADSGHYGYRRHWDPYDYGRPDYAVRCHWETRAYRGGWGRVYYQQVEVCR